MNDGTILRSIQDTEKVYAVALSPDNQILASSTGHNQVKLWRVEDGKLINTLEHPSWVSAVDFSPDGQILAAGGTDNIIRLWRVGDGELIRRLSAHDADAAGGAPYEVSGVTFSSDGQLLASGTTYPENNVKLWRVMDGQLLHTFTGQKDYVSSVAFSPDGQLLASGNYDSTLKLWRVEDRTILSPILEHKPVVIGGDRSQVQGVVKWIDPGAVSALSTQ